MPCYHQNTELEDLSSTVALLAITEVAADREEEEQFKKIKTFRTILRMITSKWKTLVKQIMKHLHKHARIWNL